MTPHTHCCLASAALTPPSSCNIPKLPFNKENMDMIRRLFVGQTVAAWFSSDRQEGGQFPSETPGEMSDKYRSELAGPGEGAAKEKIASIKSNPSWDNGLQTQFLATTLFCLIALICLFFQLHFYSCHLIKYRSTPYSYKDLWNMRNR